MLRVRFCRLTRMMVSVFVVTLCGLRMMRSLFVVTGVMMLRRFSMMPSRMPVVFRCLTMMIGCFFRHRTSVN
jgi:hypothetical protein